MLWWGRGYVHLLFFLIIDKVLSFRFMKNLQWLTDKIDLEPSAHKCLHHWTMAEPLKDNTKCIFQLKYVELTSYNELHTFPNS